MLGIKEAEYFAEAYVGLPSINFPVGKSRQIDCDFRAVHRLRPGPLDRLDLNQPDLGFVVLSHLPSLLLCCYYSKINFRPLLYARLHAQYIKNLLHCEEVTGRATG